MVPNLQHIVQQVRDSQPWDFTTKAGLCRYTNAVVMALHQADSGFGHLRKFPGQNHCPEPGGGLCAVDVALYKPTGEIVDFIGSAGFGDPPPPNPVTWFVGPEGEYGPEDWFAPVATAPPPPPGPSDNTIAERVVELDARTVQLFALHAEVSRQLTTINHQIATLTTMQLPAVTRQVDDLARRVDDLATQPAPSGSVPHHVHRVGWWKTGGPE